MMLFVALLGFLIDPVHTTYADMPAMPKVTVVRSVAAYTGFAAHYAPGVMTRVAHIRGMEPVRCMVSSPRYKLGTWLHVTSLKNSHTRLCRVTDISAPRDRLRHLRQNLVLEFDFFSAQAMCDIKFVNQEPPRACPVRVYEVKTIR